MSTKIKYYLESKTNYCLSCVILLILIISCNSKEALKHKTKILFKEEFHNFELIPSNKEVSSTFYFSNTGEKPLVITEVKTSCGCTVPEYSKEIIKSGESGEIKVLYDAKYPGRFRKTITVFYNGKDSPEKLIIKGRVAYPDIEQDSIK